MSDVRQEPEPITNRDRDVNALKAGAKLLPFGIGDALVQLHFGKDEAAKERRLAETLYEIHEKVLKLEKRVETQDNEDFSSFFAKAADPVSRATNEDKRQRFRDLLFNSMFIPQGDPAWEESMYCLELLQKIEATGLYVLAKIARADREGYAIALTKFDGNQWLWIPKEKLSRGEINVRDGKLEPSVYNYVLVEKQISYLTGKVSLVSSKPVMATHGSFATGVNYLSLTAEGEMLVKWAVADF